MKLNEEEKIRLITAAVNLQNIIATLEIDHEYQAFISLYGSRTKTLLNELIPSEDANAELQVAGDITLQSQLYDSGYLFTSLNKMIYDMGKLVVQINNNLNLTGLTH